METIKKVSDLDPHDVSVVERLVGQRLDASAEVVIAVRSVPPPELGSPADENGVPAWCNVLDGMSDEDLADFQATLTAPLRLARSPD